MFWKYAKSRIKNKERIPSLTTNGKKCTALISLPAFFTKWYVENIPDPPFHNMGELLTT